MIEHGPAIMRHENAVLCCRTFENFRIANSAQACFLSRRKVDGWLLPPNRPDDCEPEIVICLEAQAQTRDSPGFVSEAAARAF